MHDHDPDDAEMRAWLADGKAPNGVCPHCGSRISVVQRGGQFTARCSHRRCGASGPRMATLVRAVEQFCAPPAYVARHMGISVHSSSLTNVVSVLEYDRDAAMARAEAAEAEVARTAELIKTFFSDGDSLLDTVSVVLDAMGHTNAALQGAEAELRIARSILGGDAVELRDALERATKAEAEVARLRGEYARGLREAADVARAHGGISAYYAITKLAAEVEPAAEVSDG